MKALSPFHAGGMKNGYDRHAVQNLAGKNHLNNFFKGKGLHLNELSFIRVKLDLRQILSKKEMSGLVHDAFAGVIR